MRNKAKPMVIQPTPLPWDHIEDSKAFEIVDIDLAGSLFLRNGEQMWITLFTSAVYHAVHLELVDSLLAESFLLALSRFIATRDRPKKSIQITEQALRVLLIKYPAWSGTQSRRKIE